MDFPSFCKMKAGNGYRTSFWHAAWTHLGPLREAFPNLFLASLLQVISVAAMSDWQDDQWHWSDFGITAASSLSHQTATEMQQLLTAVDLHQPVQQTTDTVWWLAERHEEYSI